MSSNELKTFIKNEDGSVQILNNVGNEEEKTVYLKAESAGGKTAFKQVDLKWSHNKAP